MTKKNIKSIIAVLLVVLCILFSKHIRYVFAGDDDVIVSVPTGFYFEIMNRGNGDLYETDGLESTVYITIDKKYLNNDDTHLYVTGQYWNSPAKPLVKLNGTVIDGVKTSNTGYAKGLFSDVYFSKNYHFDVDERIVEGKTYTFYVRVGNVSKTVDVIFKAK